MSKKIVVQAYNSDTGVIGPVESESACVQQFSNAFGVVSVGMFVDFNPLSGKAQPAQANSKLTLAYGIVTKLITNTLCEVMSSGVTTLTVPGADERDILYLSPSSGGIVTRDITALDSDGFYLQPVARVLKVGPGSVCTIQLLIAGAPVADLSNLLKLDRFVYASNNSSPGAGNGALVIGDNDEDLFESSSPSGVPYKLEVQGLTKTSGLESSGQVAAASAAITGQVSAASAAITGQVTAASAAITGHVAAASALFSDSIAATNATIGNSIGVGSVYALTKIDIGGTLLAPNASINGASGTVSAVDVEASGILTGAGLSVTGTDPDAIFTNGGVKANGKLFGGSAEITNSSGSGSLTVNRFQAAPTMGMALGEVRLAAVTTLGGSPTGGASIYCYANELWSGTNNGANIALRTTAAGTTTPLSRFILSEDIGFFTVDVVANSFSPFTGCHYYPCDTEIPVGSGVVLNNGKAEISDSAMAKNCVGIALSCKVSDIDSLSGTSEGLKVVVAAVGDNRSGPLTGFLVCDEGGPVYAGDLLCTSSTPGYLMKQPDDIVRSYTVGKALQNVTFDSDGKASGVYGTICCG